MSRLVKVIVRVTTEHVGEVAIDEADYAEWRGGAADTAERVAEYLRSGDLDEVIEDVHRESLSKGDQWVFDAELVRVSS